MKTLEKVINDMALKQFRKDAKDDSDFMFKHATLSEFVTYFESKGWVKTHGYCTLRGMGGLNEIFVYNVLWARMKDDYIAAVVKMLESKLDPTIEININYGN
jgi:hypothetical protein